VLAAIEAPPTHCQLSPLKGQAPIDTTPTKRKPPTADIAAAKLQIPPVMGSIDPAADPNGRVERDGTVVMIGGVLAGQIRDLGHSLAAAEWAIHEFVVNGLLRVGLRWPDPNALPELARDLADIDPTKPVPFPEFLVGSTEQFWQWWHESRGQKFEGARLSESEQRILDAVVQIGHRITTKQLIGHLEERYGPTSEGTTKQVLAGLVRRGCLTNRQDVRPNGYGLPNWG
jgi:hypothetical protein